jgi:hypothetical protein
MLSAYCYLQQWFTVNCGIKTHTNINFICQIYKVYRNSSNYILKKLYKDEKAGLPVYPFRQNKYCNKLKYSEK